MEANKQFTPKNAPKTAQAISEDLASRLMDLIDEDEHTVLLELEEPEYPSYTEQAVQYVKARKEFLAGIILPKMTDELCQKYVDVKYNELDEALSEGSEYYSEKEEGLYIDILIKIGIIEDEE